jgi:hypothetical protein
LVLALPSPSMACLGRAGPGPGPGPGRCAPPTRPTPAAGGPHAVRRRRHLPPPHTHPGGHRRDGIATDHPHEGGV